MEKSQKKQTDKYSNRAYRPDTEVKLTGEEFMILQRILQDIRRERIGSVQVNVEGKVYQGQCLGGQDMDIEQLAAFIEQLHRKNVDAGATVPIEVLRKEFEELSKQEKTMVEPRLKVEEPAPQNLDVIAPEKKVTIKEKAEEEKVQ